ncbi:recombinase family protein [Streptomyces scabiei]|uniref:recombinase family protein n=1 Tax=Streptomyces scabiei TaxID=1930 RepID=UPI0038F665ED
MKDLIPAIGYVRVNNPRAFTESERQRNSINTWATRTGHLMVGWVEDIWVPGTGGNEAGLEELLDRVRSGEASVIAVEEIHRVSRKVVTVKGWLARLAEAGGRCESTGPAEKRRRTEEQEK